MDLMGKGSSAVMPAELAGGGEAGAAIRAHDWSGTALGHPSKWSQPLLTTVGILLSSHQPALLIWGQAHLMLCNQSVRAVLGYECSHRLGQPLHLVWPELERLVESAFSGEAVWLNNQPLILPGTDQRKNGWFNISANPVLDQNGLVGGVLCMLSDTTENVLRSDEMASELEYRKRLFEQAPSFRAALEGPDLVYKLINKAYLQLVGQRDIIGKTVAEGLPEIDEQGYLQLLHQVYRTGKPFVGQALQFMFQRNMSDPSLEKRYLNIVFQPLTDSEDKVFGVLVEGFDVTDRVLAEYELRNHAAHLRDEVSMRTQDLQQAEEALHQAQKMEALGQLTGGIAHDFNNFLMGINGALALADRRLRDGRTDEIARFISLASGSANRAAALVHRLLAFARRQPLDPQPVRVNELILASEDLLLRTIGERIELVLAPAEDTWMALCDPHQLESAILNLTINARDAMPAGGKLTISSQNVHMDQVKAQVPGSGESRDYVCLLVSDTGSGMAPEVLEHVFEPFFTTKPMGQGTGLGLSMVYGFARQSEGYVHIDSEVGVGTTIRLCLPRSRHPSKEAAAPVQADAASEDCSRKIVLVVEDDETVRPIVVDVLHELGYLTMEAADGLSGLRILQSKAKLDLLVSDIGLPGMSGLEMVDAARDDRPGLKVLFMTAYAQTQLLDQGRQESVRTVISKPFDMDEFAQQIKAVMETDEVIR